ncbi:winged helix-turn-helix domain-containing protein [Photobacterium atrarenae]|uniref:Winged helix-turn-helix domain-containing protein n=2 Tax=Photobacterium atrarenae TaxID=865757 RepID=A0ABY5GJD0_9GAMM|nr:winged helix-turn-helix domain-containing protein [Photobacterium atrarenae]
MGEASGAVVNKRIMLVEDDSDLAVLIQEFLERYEFAVSVVNDGQAAVTRIIDEQPDLVILDIMLPGLSGMEVCRQVRQQYDGYILMQTALDDDIDQMLGLELGADDYVIKQVQPRLLLSRIRALLRRATPTQDVPPEPNSFDYQFGALSIDLTRRSVLLDSQPVDLTTAEFELLCLLAKHSGEVVTREEIVQQLRGLAYDGLDRSIDRRISRLRKALNDDTKEQAQVIKTVRGKGYQLCIR